MKKYILFIVFAFVTTFSHGQYTITANGRMLQISYDNRVVNLPDVTFISFDTYFDIYSKNLDYYQRFYYTDTNLTSRADVSTLVSQITK